VERAEEEGRLPDLSGLDPHQRRDYSADTHYATPVRALSLLSQIDRLPEIVHVLGCEPVEQDELRMELSPPVSAALDEAERRVRAWLDERLQASGHPPVRPD
jgi:hydrogenase maturation protease